MGLQCGEGSSRGQDGLGSLSQAMPQGGQAEFQSWKQPLKVQPIPFMM